MKEKNPNILWKTKAVVIGPMEKSIEEGKKLRAYVKDELAKMEIILWDHYDNPFQFRQIKGTEEDLNNQIAQWKKNGEFDKVAALREIRLVDLSLIDKADFIIMCWDAETLSCGTFEEFFWANRMKKPIFIFSKQGKKALPSWMFWTIPHKYFYDSLEDVLDMLRRIDSGEKEIDSTRWKLLRYKYR